MGKSISRMEDYFINKIIRNLYQEVKKERKNIVICKSKDGQLLGTSDK